MDEEKKDVTELQLVVFKIGNEEYGVEISEVQEINRMIEITKIPRAPEFVEGVINLRGKVIPVIDLRKRFGMEKKDYDKNSRIIVVEIDEKLVGMIVDAVTEVLRITSDSIEPPPPIIAGIGSEYLKGVGKLDDRMLILLDLSKVFTDTEKEHLLELQERKDLLAEEEKQEAETTA